MEFEALIFDCDGTLSDSMPVHYEATRQILHPHAIEFTWDRFYDLAGVPTPRVIQILAAEQGREVDATALAQAKERRFFELFDTIRPIEWVVARVRAAQGISRLAVASGGTREVVERQLRLCGLAEVFEAVVSAEDVARHKPAPDTFLEAARQLGVRPENCCVYEDADLGIEAARAAGMKYVDIRLGPASRPAA